METDTKTGTAGRISLRWLPRVMAIMYILWLMCFSFDVFGEKLSFWGTALGLFMHNVPAFALLVVLVVSWKYELAGAIIFSLAGIVYVIWLINTPRLSHMFASCLLMISAPAFMTGILFLASWMAGRNKEK